VYRVLEELKMEEKNTILVVNKIDAMPSRVYLEGILRRYPHAIPVSARTGAGIDRLSAAVSEALSRAFRDVEIETGVDNGRLLAYLAAKGEVLSQSYQGETVRIHCRLPQKYLGRIQDAQTRIWERASGARIWPPSDGDALPDRELGADGQAAPGVEVEDVA
jgi:GTP-binding protein HflX